MANRGADVRPTAASLFDAVPITSATSESKALPQDQSRSLSGVHPASAPIAVPTRRNNAALSGMSLPLNLPLSPARSTSPQSAPPLQDNMSSGLGSGSICPVGDSISIGKVKPFN